MVAEAVDPMKDEMVGVKQDMASISTRLKKLEEGPGGVAADQTSTNRIKVMEKEISEFKASPVQSKDNATAVVGGLRGATSSDTAKSWLPESMTKSNIEGILDVYDKCKDEEFNGMLFVKFSTSEKRDNAINSFNAARITFSDAKTYMNEDRPVSQRTKFSFLLNTKKLLVGWKFENVQFDDLTGVLSIAGTHMLMATVEGTVFKLTWLDDEWKEWKQFTDDKQFTALVKTAEGKLEKASQNKGKGKAKSA